MKRFLNPQEIPPDAIVLDARPNPMYLAGHIPGARHAEFLEKFLIRDSPQRKTFEAAIQTLVRRCGLHAGLEVVVYDSGRDTRASRLAWALEYAGFEVALLRHGWNDWSGPVETIDAEFQPSDYLLESPRLEILATAEEVLHRDEHTLLIDTRNTAEYRGTQLPPGSARGGHIPGARHLNWEDLTTQSGLKDDAALEEALKDIPSTATVIVHCQSGARSSVVYHALKARGVRVSNYLGSMHEWAADTALPLQTT